MVSDIMGHPVLQVLISTSEQINSHVFIHTSLVLQNFTKFFLCPTFGNISNGKLHWKITKKFPNQLFMTHAFGGVPKIRGSVRVAERLALPTSDHRVTGSNPAGGEILPEPKRRFIAQSLSCSPFHRLEMTAILLMGRKTLTHPSKNKTSIGSTQMKCGKYSTKKPMTFDLLLV